MNNLKAFDLNFGTVVLRFYLMMAVVITAGFTGLWLLGLLALPIFISIMMGVNFNSCAKFEKKLNANAITLKNTRKEKLQEVA